MKHFIAVFLIIASAAIYSGPSSSHEPPDLQNPLFKAGHPLNGEALETSVSSQRDINNLAESISFLKRNYSVFFSITGFTDRSECSGEDCHQLALRRAQLVLRRLLDAGIDARRLIALNEYGSERYIAVNPDERYRNQRVEIQLFFDYLDKPIR